MTPPEKLIGPSKHPHSSDALMKEARRLLRAAGYTYKHAGSAVVHAGQQAYEVMADWLGVDEPTVELAPLRYAEKLEAWELVVETIR